MSNLSIYLAAEGWSKPKVSSKYVHHLLLSRGVPVSLCAA